MQLYNIQLCHFREGDSIKVFVRVRPPDIRDNEVGSKRVVDVDEGRKAIIMQSKPEPKLFTFDQVADIHITQESVFTAVGKKIIEGCVTGYNGTIFAYGQTGSGKTFTMLGPSEDADNFQHEMRGVIPRGFEYLFSLINREQELHGERKQFLCRCSFIEIYQEQVFDLLDPASTGLHLRENIKTGVYVDGIVEQAVANYSEAYQVLNAGWLNRRVAATSMNRESSRSHAVFTVSIESKEQKGGVQNLKTSQLNLVDLAGSERQKDTHAIGARLKEAGSINKSLSVLGNVIMSLGDIAHGKSRHVPYRDSKLTFLLRDSLGGNAKTHIVACVHPGSRCFGETLSTLMFARRAKMIKNKAVLNEDTQGNLMHLQAEIRRLKEMLAQFVDGNIPKAIGGSTEETPVTTASSDNSEWKKFFMEAMFFREKSEQEKKNILQDLSKYEELCSKKEKFLQSTKMIIKFRENHIARLEKSLKAKEPVPLSEKDIEIAELKEELMNVKNQLEHHPTFAKYAMEVQHLKSEIKLSRSHNLQSTMSDTQCLSQLENTFHKLLTNKTQSSDLDIISPSSTPQQNDTVSTATIERYKSQINTLQAELDEVKKQSLEHKEEREKKQVELEAELTSSKKMICELEQVLEAHKLKSRIEREALSDMHAQTLKVMTTPTRAKYHLRNRTIVAKCSGDKPPSTLMDDSIEEEDHSLLNETQPTVMMEMANEALTEEIKQLQDTNNKMSERLEEFEADQIRLRQQMTKIGLENSQLNEILSNERSSWTEKEETMTARINKLKSEYDEAESNSSMYKLEVRDLKIILSGADKELREYKQKSKLVECEKDKVIQTLETKILQVDMELDKFSKELDSVTKEKEILQEELETTRETLIFNEDCMTDLSDKLKEESSLREKTQTELESTLDMLHLEESRLQQLKQQMSQEGQEQEKQLVNVMAEVTSLQNQNSSLQNMCDVQTQNTNMLRKELDHALANITSQEKQLAEEKSAMASLITKVQELKSNLSVENERNISLTSALQTSEQNSTELQIQCEDQHMKLEALRNQLNDLGNQLDREKNSNNVEMSMLKDDYECMTEAYNKINSELEFSQKSVELAQEEQDRMNEQILLLKKELKESEEIQIKLKESYEVKVKEVESNVTAKGSESEAELTKMLDEKSQELNKYPFLNTVCY
ncbi:hypothetical protein SNE40_017987 [Patella caerulea]|uniref:Kinesin motor domain-containing protein n=1 Tax=Patella caerulea TaxID=87958 RepID=A0AAN8JEW8_PATCE